MRGQEVLLPVVDVNFLIFFAILGNFIFAPLLTGASNVEIIRVKCIAALGPILLTEYIKAFLKWELFGILEVTKMKQLYICFKHG